MALTNIETTIILDLYDHDTTPTKIKAIALDSNTRYVSAVIRNAGGIYDIGANTGVTLTVIRPDRVGVQITGEPVAHEEVTPDEQTVTTYGAYAELSQAALAKNGTLRAQFMLTSGDQILRTEIFTINCGEALDASTDTWAGEYQGYNLDELVQNVNEAVTKVDAMEDDVSDLKEGLENIENEIAELPKSVTPEETEADLYISDANGNVLAEFTDGHIKTKNFDSGDIEERVEALEETPIPSGSEYAPSINPTDADADLYIADENGNAVARFGNGHVQTRDFYSRAITPKVITVKKDGAGDFTSIRSAVDSIHDASSIERPYVIEIYPGTYNILDDYSQSEIEATGFVGLMLTDGISLRGVGNRNAVVLHGELDPDIYDSTLRNEVSTLNMCDTASLENLTITARRIRYCVHDDFPATLPYFYRHVKNCRFSIDTPTSGSEGKTWGEGAKQGKSTLLEDSDFGTCLLWHSDNTASATRTINLTIKNCTAQFLTVRNINHNIFNTVHIYGGNFGIIRFTFDDGTVQTKMMSVDGDVKDAMILAPTDWCYKTGDITIFPISTSMSLVIGALVRPNFSPFWTQGSLVVVTDPNTAYGVVVGIDDRFAYVQKSGYINTDRIGLQNVSIGDKVTVSQNGSLELNGTGDEFGVVFASFTDLGSYVRRT